MDILRTITIVASCAAEVYIYSLFYSVFTTPKNDRRLKIILSCAAFVLLSANSLFIDIFPLKAGISILAIIIISYRNDCGLLKRAYTALIVFILMCAAEIITGAATAALLGTNVGSIIGTDMTYIIDIVISKLTAFIAVKLFVSAKKPRGEFDSGFSAALLIIFVLIIFYMVFMIDGIFTGDDQSNAFLSVTAIVIMAAAVISVFILNDRQIKYKEYQRRLKELELQYKLKVKEYENIRDNARLAGKNIHDVKNFSLAINSYLEQGKIAQAQQKLREYTEKTVGPVGRSSGIPTVDALLKAKLEQINELCDSRYVSVVLDSLGGVDEIDFCILLGNATDNAIEECRRIEDKKDRAVEIRVLPIAGGISIYVKNKTSGKAKKGISSKGNDLLHGFGIENMRAICEKYGGDIITSEHDGYFELSIFLPNIQAD